MREISAEFFHPKKEAPDCLGNVSVSLDEIGELIDPITADVDNVAETFDNSKELLNTARDNFTEIAETVQKKL